MGYSSDIGSIPTLHGFVASIKIPATLSAASAVSLESDLKGMFTFLEKLNDACYRVMPAVTERETSPGYLALRNAYLAQRPVQEQLAREKAQAAGVPYEEPTVFSPPAFVSMAQQLASQAGKLLSEKFESHRQKNFNLLEDYPFAVFLEAKEFFDLFEFNPEYLEDAALTKQRVQAMARVTRVLTSMVHFLLEEIDLHKEVTKADKKRGVTA